MAQPDIAPVPVKPEEAIAFFRAKGFVLEPSFDWRDVSAKRHAESFTVAKSSGFDILGDIHAAVDEAIAEGTTLQDFQKRLTPILQAKGWWGKKDREDPATGETKTVQLGSPRRLKVIFQTNLRMAYMAGKWQRFMRLKEKRPWLRYVAVQDARTRPLHKSWHGTILKWDHPWWVQHYPPNDFGCRCDVQSLSDRDLERFKLTPSKTSPAMLERTYVNPRTGEVSRVPDGIRPGFDHNVGQLAAEAHAGKRLADRLVTLPPALAAEAWAASAQFVLSGISYELQGFIAQVLTDGYLATGAFRVVGTLKPEVLDTLKTKGIEPETAAIALIDKQLQHVWRDAKNAKQALSRDEIMLLPQLLNNPIAILIDRRDPALLYVFEAASRDRKGKLVVRVNYRHKPPREKGVKPQAITFNAVVSGGVVPESELRQSELYEVVWGAV